MPSPVIRLHPLNPQHRRLAQLVDCLSQGGVLAFPTDSGYALLANLDQKKALDTICKIRQVSRHHFFTLIGHDVAQLAPYVQISTPYYRFLKKNTPNPTTFIFPALPSVGKKVMALCKRKTIGIRITRNLALQSLLRMLDQPLLTTSLMSEADSEHVYEAFTEENLQSYLNPPVDFMVITHDYFHHDVSTVVDCTESLPSIIRLGCGNVAIED